MSQQKGWLAAYLCYNEPWEEFLRKGVDPFIRQTIAEGKAEQYFFIRYWEKGPHIRLRFFGDLERMEQELKPELEQHFQHYLQQHPSDRFEPLESLPEGFELYPNNSIQFIDYEPETERYGGEKALMIAEKHFQDSSDAVLAIIQESADWNYDRAMGAAIQLHIGFAHATGMDINEAKAFFQHISAGWLPMAYGSYFHESPDNEERKAETLASFARIFEQQKNTLVPYHQMLWEAFEEEVEFEQDWLNDWINNLKETKTALAALQTKEQISFPYRLSADNRPMIPPTNRQLWSIYSSYVHMTNNRLGIRNRDEGYLGYLIQRSMELL